MRSLLGIVTAIVLVSSCTGAREGSPSTPPVSKAEGSASEQPVSELPPPTRAAYRSKFVGKMLGYRFWPISGPAEQGVTYRFDVPHCGLAWMLDFDGSFWRPLDPNLPEPKAGWAFLINADRGTIELVATNTAEYVSSTRRHVKLVRLDGPIVAQPCD